MESEVEGPKTTTSYRKRWWTPEEDAAVRRKLDVHILPIMFCCFMFSFLDRTNIGNAKTSMVKALGLSDHEFVWLLTIFYISFTAFQFLLISYSIFPPRKYVATCIFVWGLCGTLQAVGHNWSSYMAFRFFLGVAEAGFSSGAAYYFSTLYPRREAGFRFSLFISAGAFSSSWSGALAYALLHIKTGFEGWRALFLIEGLLTIVFAPVVWFFLPNNTATAWFLTDRERRIAAARLLNDNLILLDDDPASASSEKQDSEKQDPEKQGDGHEVRPTTASKETYRDLFNVKDALLAFQYPLSFVAATLFFCVSLAASPFAVYLPTILEGLGYSTIDSQGFSVPPYLCALATSLAGAYFCDRYGGRGLLSATMMMLGAIGYVVLALVESNRTRYFACIAIAISTFTSAPIIYFWAISNQFNHSRRGLTLVLIGTIGQGGPFVGTRLFPKREGPRYKRGMLVCAGVLLLSFTIAITMVVWMYFQNRKRQRLHPIGKPETQEEADERERDLGKKATQSVYFRWEY
ncbi:hypothetical protein CF326_g5028 [Tilletia indica]|nr:hypothetical protein CF326_g5028 [Tilletia indica]